MQLYGTGSQKVGLEYYEGKEEGVLNADFATYTGHTRRRNHDRSFITGPIAPALSAARGYLAAVVDGEGNGSVGESVADTLIATLSAVYYHGSAHDDADQALGRALDMAQHALAEIMERDGSAGASLAAVIVRAGVRGHPCRGPCALLPVSRWRVAALD